MRIQQRAGIYEVAVKVHRVRSPGARNIPASTAPLPRCALQEGGSTNTPATSYAPALDQKVVRLMTRSILSGSSARGGQSFVQPVIDAVVAVAWSGHFAVLVGALAARELDYLLRTLERVVEFARLPRKELLTLRVCDQHGAADAAGHLREVVIAYGVKGVIVRRHAKRTHAKA